MSLIYSSIEFAFQSDQPVKVAVWDFFDNLLTEMQYNKQNDVFIGV